MEDKRIGFNLLHTEEEEDKREEGLEKAISPNTSFPNTEVSDYTSGCE